MVSLIIQTVLLIAIAFIVGCVLGCLLRGLLAPRKPVPAEAADGEEIPATLSEDSGSQPVAAKEPVVPSPPIPVEPVRPDTAAKVEIPPDREPANQKKTTAKKSETRTAKAAAAAADADNLKLIRGIGPQNEARLNGLGINSFSQISAWTKKDQAHYGEVLAFPGRIEREDWVGQAKVLAKGGTTRFSKRVKSGAVQSSMASDEPEKQVERPKDLLEEARNGKPDDLTQIAGVGKALEKKLFRQGVFHFDQIARMSEDELTWLGNAVGFPDRPHREDWAGKAQALAEGGIDIDPVSATDIVKAKDPS